MRGGARRNLRASAVLRADRASVIATRPAASSSNAGVWRGSRPWTSLSLTVSCGSPACSRCCGTTTACGSPYAGSLHSPLVLPLSVQRGGTNNFIPHWPPPWSSASSSSLPIWPGWSEPVTYEEANCPRSQLPPDGTKTDHICLTSTSDTLGLARPTVVSMPTPGDDDDVLYLFLQKQVLTSKIRDRPRSNILNELL